MIPTLRQNREEVAAFLAPLAGVANIGAVYAFGAARETDGPVYVTVEYDGGGVDPETITCEVRVYVKVLDAGFEGGADLRDDAVEAADALLDTQSTWGPSGWTFGFVETLGCLVASCRLDRGREDLL